MNLSEELKKIDENKNSINGLINALFDEQEELGKKLHVLKVIKIANDIDEMIKNDDFMKAEIIYMKLLNNYSEDYSYRVLVDLHNKDHKEISNYNLLNNPIDSIKGIGELFSILDGFRPVYASDDFMENSRKIIPLDNFFKENFINLLLSKDLKTTLEYYKMEKELSHPSSNKIKQPKV